MTDKQDSTQDASDAGHMAKVADPRYVLIDASSGQVEGRKYHTYLDCTFLDKQPPEEIEPIGDREIRLLGIKACSVCEKRASGGPAIDALTEILGPIISREFSAGSYNEETQDVKTYAWEIVNELKSRGVHLTVRKAK